MNENLATIIAVTFVLALVSLGFNFFNLTRINEVAVVTGAIDVGVNAKHTRSIEGLKARIDQLEQELAAQKNAADDRAAEPTEE